MNEILNWLFGFGSNAGKQEASGSLGFGSPDAHLSFVHPMASWLIGLGLVVLVGLVWWSYRSVPGSRTSRSVLGIVRALVVVVLAGVALGPMIEQTNIRTEQDWALVLLDRSGSLSTKDARSVDGKNGLISRNEQLRGILDRARQSEQWAQLATKKRVVWMGFDEEVSTIGIGEVPLDESIGETRGRATDIGSAIVGALDQAKARPISSIVLVSDGRSETMIDPEIVHQLNESQIPVFVVALGSDEPVRDIGIAQIEAPTAVFADDLVPIRVRLSSSGISDTDLQRSAVRVELVEHSTGRIVGSHEIDIEDLTASNKPTGNWITIMHTPTAQSGSAVSGNGERAFDVRLVSADSKSGIGRLDLNTTNDKASLRLRVVERAMRVLFVDGYPRWEQRYLKNLLLREKSIVSSSLLLASSRRYVQEGDEVIAALPTTLEQWEPYDVVILGDVRSELFSDEQLESLLEHVQVHGAGLLWIAGQSSTPTSWYDSKLASLLPMHGDSAGSLRAAPAWDSAVTMRSSVEADRLGVLGLNDARDGWFDRLSDPATGWSKLQWALALDETSFKPGISVLANARSVVDGSEAPIVTMMRYGAGRTILVGTDEIWRWRYGRGEDLPERFWLPMIRTLGRGTVERRVASASLSLTPEDPKPDEPTQVSLRLFDQQRIDTMPDEVLVEIRSSVEIDEPRLVTLRGSGDSRVGTWIPDQPGQYTASLVGVDVELSQVSGQARVLDISDEQRLLDSDHQALAMLAEKSGGRMIADDEFGSVPDLMPNRTRTIASAPRQQSLWDRPIVLIVLVVLLSIEWLGRRSLRLA